jgi:cytochrome c2
MFDTMTLTKATGALCGSLLVFLLGGWVAGSIYATGGGHGDERVQGFVIDTGADDATEAVAEAGPSFAELFAAADTANGEKVFRNCAACHALEKGENKAGPYLYGVVGRDVGAAEGFGAYSGALTAVVDVWTPEALYAFLENPKGFAPGTSMGYAGLRKSEDRADLIAFLDQTDGTTYEMPAAATAPAEEAPAKPAATEEAPAEKEAAVEAPAEETVVEAAPEAAAPEATEEAAAEAAPEATEEPAAEASSANGFAALVAAADLAEGEKLFRRCAACHAVEAGKNKAGPSLFGIVGRDIASADGFSYSDALAGLEGEWTLDKLSAWIENPRAYAPGNRMGFPGLKDEGDRANLMGYLQSIGN